MNPARKRRVEAALYRAGAMEVDVANMAKEECEFLRKMPGGTRAGEIGVRAETAFRALEDAAHFIRKAREELRKIVEPNQTRPKTNE